MDPLPIDPHVSEVVEALARSRAVVVVADPGAGKTTRIPPALVGTGPVLLLQPRRAAARAIARRIAAERGWTVGREVGWQVRFDRHFGPGTSLLVATEGILTARLQQDPLVTAFRTIILDEFHERSVHADLGIALAKQAWRAREDLRLVIMSATIDAEAVAEFLEDCPIVRVRGRRYPLTIAYAPDRPVAEAISDVLQQNDGDVLCFLPGAVEIGKAIAAIGAASPQLEVLPLHGALDPAEQDRALSRATAGPRRVIVATNIAETSLTVPGVRTVVDSGLQKVARYDAARAIDSLEIERISQDAADQRAGRAGRTGPGMAVRLWDSRDRLRVHREPDIHRIDLSGTVLDILAWGGNPRSLEWFEKPRTDAIESALRLLERLGAMQAGRLSPLGRQLSSMPLHPRLSRIVIAGRGASAVCRACAILSERLFLPRTATTSSDLLSALDRWDYLPRHIHEVARQIEQIGRIAGLSADVALPEYEFRQALLSGYPDRVARRRETDSPRVKLSSGVGAVVASTSGVHSGEFLIAVDLQSPTRRVDGDNRVLLASVIEREWLAPTATEIVHRIDESGTVKALEQDRYDELVLRERAVAVDEEVAAELLADRWLQLPRREEDDQLLRRLAFAAIAVDLPAMVRAAARGRRKLSDVTLQRAMVGTMIRRLETDAPETLLVPSGRQIRLEYNEDGSVSASVKLQELFGLGETPRVGPRQEPVLLALLAPNGRPVQVTRDLRSFWNRTYPEVRKELRGRYPKHPWPDDPWSAPPTARTTKRRS